MFSLVSSRDIIIYLSQARSNEVCCFYRKTSIEKKRIIFNMAMDNDQNINASEQQDFIRTFLGYPIDIANL